MSLEIQREQTEDKHSFDIEVLLKEIEEKNKTIAKLKELLSELLGVVDGIPYSEMFTNDINVCEKVRKLLNESK